MVGGYIQPAGTIQLYKGINISPNYSDVVLFESYAARDAYFGASAKTFTQESYTRETADSVKILCTSTEVDSCNYMRFQNNINGASRWYYAFITAVEYVNNNTTRVYYKIDEFTTWFLKDMLQQCFVEREIPDHDEVGDNIVPENLELGEYVNSSPESAFDLNDMVIVLAASTDKDGDYPKEETIHKDAQWVRVNGMQSPLLYAFFDPDSSQDMDDLQLLLWNYNQNGYMDNIIFLQLVPKFCTENALVSTSGGQHYASYLWHTQKPISLDGYVPKNKKLMTYPYSFLRGSDKLGTISDYKYEFFYEADECYFMFYGCLYGEPSIIALPSSYKGFALAWEESLVATNFPQCPTANDTYKAWLAQNANSIGTSVLATILSTGVGIAAGVMTAGAAGVPAYIATMGTLGAVGSAASGAGNILQTMAKVSDADKMPTTISGLPRANMINLVLKQYKISFYKMSITKQMAKKIDDFFTAYGYAVHNVKKPCLSGRPYFNYVKTQGCILAGDIPATAKAAIIQAFDNGIRLWKTNSRIGTFDGNEIS